MKHITYEKKNDLKHGIKAFSIKTHTEQPDSTTDVQKSFAYHVKPVDHIEPAEGPQVYVTKSFDSKTLVEKFNFQVKGNMYVTHNRFYLLVEFHHTLDIKILWKDKDLSPKKSVVMTK
jgi:hypothetical protein